MNKGVDKMYYTDIVRKQIATALEGFEPDDVAIVFYDQLVTLLDNDPTYFASGHGNSLSKTLEWASNLVKEGSK